VLTPDFGKRSYLRMPYFGEILKLKEVWQKHVRKLQSSRRSPVTISRGLKEVRDALKPDAFVVSSSGNTQAQILQEFPFFRAGTCITTGGASTMGFAVPAAIGVKLAHPKRQVCAIVGDGDFMMTMQEMATAKQLGTDILILVFNNQGWISIKDLQMEVYGPKRAFATDFKDRKGKLYSPDFAACAKAFGLYSDKVSKYQEIKPAIEKALAAGGPALVEITVNRTHPHSGSPAVGWWDVPVPAYLKERRAKYEKARKQEKL